MCQLITGHTCADTKGQFRHVCWNQTPNHEANLLTTRPLCPPKVLHLLLGYKSKYTIEENQELHHSSHAVDYFLVKKTKQNKNKTVQILYTSSTESCKQTFCFCLCSAASELSSWSCLCCLSRISFSLFT